MRIYVDCQGGDNAPKAQVLGALAALDEYPDLELVLAGDEPSIKALVGDKINSSRIQIEHCTESISNHESPALAIRQKKDSAIVKGMLSLREKNVDGFVSSGSTGAVLLGGMLRLGRIQGIDRPALAPLIPNGKGQFLLIDCGANVDCKPEYLLQFAAMGEAYMKIVKGVKNPRIGLANIGEEAEKGNALTKEAYPLLKNSPFNFVGNVEARYITADKADVIVCDGFVGNIILKFMEGVAKTLLGIIKKELLADTLSKIGALMAKPAFSRVKKLMDYKEVGGAPLLGVSGSVVKAHGSSDERAFKNAIGQCVNMVKGDIAQAIADNIQSIKEV
ncbi:MAG: phosphate acyltransferase PlsX [Eubacteriales bacterium]|nr:phosphate acyltransferase PlsX [Eubacteriales bacterium]